MKLTRGFTLIEMVIVVAIVALLAGVLVPVAFNQIDDAEQARTMSDIRHVASALLLFRNDVGGWPMDAGVYYGDGNAATGENLFEATDLRHLRDALRDNAPAASNWGGPYMTSFPPDPWGNRYVVVSNGFSTRGAPYAWIISAGADGKFQTGPNDITLQGDDIGIIMH